MKITDKTLHNVMMNNENGRVKIKLLLAVMFKLDQNLLPGILRLTSTIDTMFDLNLTDFNDTDDMNVKLLSHTDNKTVVWETSYKELSSPSPETEFQLTDTVLNISRELIYLANDDNPVDIILINGKTINQWMLESIKNGTIYPLVLDHTKWNGTLAEQLRFQIDDSGLGDKINEDLISLFSLIDYVIDMYSLESSKHFSVELFDDKDLDNPLYSVTIAELIEEGQWVEDKEDSKECDISGLVKAFNTEEMTILINGMRVEDHMEKQAQITKEMLNIKPEELAN